MNLKTFICFLIILSGICSVAIAQDLKLQDITKITLNTGIPDNINYSHRTMEVVQENGQWNAYQTVLYKNYDPKTKKSFGDSTRRFVKLIPEDTLTLFLAMVAKPDTVIKVDNFNINADELVKYIDTVHPQISVRQKQEFIDSIHSKTAVNDILLKYIALRIGFTNDNPHGFTILTKGNKEYFGDSIDKYGIYLLPWAIKEKRSNDPRITMIFNFIMDDEKETQRLRNRMHKQAIDWQMNWVYFQTPFYWEDIKTKHPDVFASFKGTLTPAVFVKSKAVGNNLYVSSRLPNNVLIKFWLFSDSAFYKFKPYEDTLVDVFKKQKFFVKYFESVKAATVKVHPARMLGPYGASIFIEIKHYYPPAGKLDYNKFLPIYLSGNGIYSRWMVLPNNEMILLSYTGTLVYGANNKFKGILPPDPGEIRSKRVCIVFDNKGKRVGGSEDAMVDLP
jgi:hypothetical protein